MVYTTEQDPLCYEGTAVLINKLETRDQAVLDQFEVSMFVTRFEEPWPWGDLVDDLI